MERGDRGFGSSGSNLTFLSLDLDQRPTLQLTINGIKIMGLLDTGADKSIIAAKDWPKGWPMQMSTHTLQGLGYSNAPNMSANCLQWQDNEGHSGIIQPYVLELPISLRGRDLLKDMGFKLSNEYSISAQRIMERMGCHPSYGLGKFLQGHVEPSQTKPREKRQGLGLS